MTSEDDRPRSDRTRGEGDPKELIERFKAYRETGDRRLRNELVTSSLSLAEACARRFANRGEPLSDLEQVAMVGLVKAVERFDPSFGIPFAGFAVPTITGELRRHFRDATWAVKVPRRAKDLHVRVPEAIAGFTADHGRAPRPAELAERLGVSVDEVIDALDAGNAYRSTSTDTEAGAAAAHHAVSRRPEDGLDTEDAVILKGILAELPERERTIVYLRYFEDLHQAEIAERVGVSQVHVSRLLRRTLRTLRTALEASDGAVDGSKADPDEA